MNNPLKTNENGMTWKGNRLFAKRTHVATIDTAGKVLYITNRKLSKPATEHIHGIAWLARHNGFHIVTTKSVEAYALILDAE